MKTRTAIAAVTVLALAISANAAPIGQLGILDDTANGGINPVTSAAWAGGDQYRLVFVSSTRTNALSGDIAYYNAHVQAAANAAGLGGVTWNAIASTSAAHGGTATVDARDNTSTNFTVTPVGMGIILSDGTTKIADNYTALWDGSIDNRLDRDENGAVVPDHDGPYGAWKSVWAGTTGSGTNRGAAALGGNNRADLGLAEVNTTAQWIRRADISGLDGDELCYVYAMSEALTIPGGGPPPPPPPTEPYKEAVLVDGPFAYYRLDEARGSTTATNLGTVGAPLNGTYNNASGFSYQEPSLLPSGENLSVRADGGSQVELRLPDHSELNTGAHDNKTVELWFKADADSITSTRSVLYEQGGNTRGISIYLEEVGGVDTLFMGAWNLAESDWPVTFVETPVSEGTPYYAVFVLDGDPDGNDGSDDGFVRGYLDGELIAAIAGAGNLRGHANNTAAMGIWENVRYADGATQGDGANVAGWLDELALYNILLDDPNNDGDLSDSRVLDHFNAAGGGDIIPEPTTMALLGLGALALLRRRRRA
ncbi:PEP-CTERM sorting domain-containing protein [Planctomycetota bacterium]